MKPLSNSFLILAIFVFALNISLAQIQIDPTPSQEEMVEFLIGPGVTYSNVLYTGADGAAGIFTNGGSTNLGVEEGLFLTTGSGYLIPGPNMSCSSGANNGNPGSGLLGGLTTTATYDASVLEFDFIPMNDTVRCHYVFGSEEYSEWVYSSFNDVFGFFVAGLNPLGGSYENQNVALIPGTFTPVTINNVNNGSSPCGIIPTGPGTNSEYFVDNTSGLTIEYDGFTTVLTAWVLVIPGEEYHFIFGVADAGDGIYDSGVFLEGTSFKSPGPAEFFEFNFLTENNPSLTFDIIGTLDEYNVYLEVPDGTDVTSLVASFEEHGADVFVDGQRQISGVSANDFTEPVIYHLEGYEQADWTVYVEVVTDIPQYLFNQVKMGANPDVGQITVENIGKLSVSVINTIGNTVYKTSKGQNNLLLDDLLPGIYFVKMEKDGITEVRKVIVH